MYFEQIKNQNAFETAKNAYNRQKEIAKSISRMAVCDETDSIKSAVGVKFQICVRHQN